MQIRSDAVNKRQIRGLSRLILQTRPILARTGKSGVIVTVTRDAVIQVQKALWLANKNNNKNNNNKTTHMSIHVGKMSKKHHQDKLTRQASYKSIDVVWQNFPGLVDSLEGSRSA